MHRNQAESCRTEVAVLGAWTPQYADGAVTLGSRWMHAPCTGTEHDGIIAHSGRLSADIMQKVGGPIISIFMWGREGRKERDETRHSQQSGDVNAMGHGNPWKRMGYN